MISFVPEYTAYTHVESRENPIAAYWQKQQRLFDIQIRFSPQKNVARLFDSNK